MKLNKARNSGLLTLSGGKGDSLPDLGPSSSGSDWVSRELAPSLFAFLAG